MIQKLIFRLIIITSIVSSNLTFAQVNGLIHNAGFEQPFGNTVNDSVPINKAQCDKLSIWEPDMKIKTDNNGTPGYPFDDVQYELHSPDWFSNDYYVTQFNQIFLKEHFVYPPNNDVIQANSELAYIGMSSCELIQQKFFVNNKLEEGEDYTLSMYIMIAHEDAQAKSTAYGYNLNNHFSGDMPTLKAYVKKQKMKYSTAANNINNWCTNSYCNKKTELLEPAPIEVLSESITINKFPVGEWHKITSTFTAPHQSFNWFIIELQQNDIDCYVYVLIDDVSLIKECCIVECSRTDRCMNPVIGYEHKAEIDGWWFVDNLDNVTQAEIEIFDISGPKIKTYSVSSINGITEPIYWDGTDFNGNEQSPSPSAYPYSITLTNDCGTEEWDGSIFKSVLGPTPPPPITVYNNGVVTPEPCCAEQPDIYIDNQTLSGPGALEFVATNNIYIATNGPVTVSNNANVLFQAGNEIVVGTYDYNEELGAEISKVIVPCPGSGNGKKDDDDGNDYIFTETNEEEQEDEPQPNDINETSGITIHPNPTSGEFTLTIPATSSQQQATIYIYDIFGRLIHKSEIVNRQSEIVNISTHPKGIYLVKVIQVYPVGRDDRIGVEKVYIKKLIHQ